MKVALKDLIQKTLYISKELPTSFFGKEITLTEPVRVNLKLNKSGDEISVRGVVETVVRLSCSRCLEGFSYNIDTDIDVIYQPFKKEICEKAEELKEDDLIIATYTEPVINLDGDIREAIHLAIPMKPLCSEECQGLCPNCGQNLNVKRCECITHSIDPRLADLGKLLKKE